MPKKQKHKTILIVDDKPANLSALAEVLAQSNFRVLIAESGYRALEICKNTTPDAILLDVMMPGMDGYETCETLKSNPDFMHIPVVFMTALSETEDKVRAFQAGAVDYVSKPLQQEEVLARVRTHLTVSELQFNLKSKVDELEHTIEERDTLIEDLNAYAYSVAHDLKNPLTILCGVAETLSIHPNRHDEEELQKKLKTMSQYGWQMRSIIDELLLFSSVRKEDIQTHVFSMQDIVDEALQPASDSIESSRTTIKTPSSWPQVKAYGPWIGHVWSNYISNAIKYGGKPPHVELGWSDPGSDHIHFFVRDNGEGLTKEQCEKVFQAHQRFHDKTIPGNGLGLSIVSRIIEKLEGKVWAESDIGKGSKFCFSLPKAKETES